MLSGSTFAQTQDAINADQLHIRNGVCRISFPTNVEELVRQTKFVNNIRQSMELDSRVFQQKSLRDRLKVVDIETLKAKGYYVDDKASVHGDFTLVGSPQCWTYNVVSKFFGKEDYCVAKLDLIQLLSANASPNPTVKSMNSCDAGYGNCFAVSIAEGSKPAGRVQSKFDSGPNKTTGDAISEAIELLPSCRQASSK